VSGKPILDEALVKRVADLARIDLEPADVVFYQAHLDKILQYVAQLDHVATSAEPSLSPEPVTPERPDVVIPSLEPEIAVGGAARTSGTSFQVPRIIE